MSIEAPKVEEKILHKTIRILPEIRTHLSQPKDIQCRKDVVGLDYAHVKCTREEQAQDYKTRVEEGMIQRELSPSEKQERATDPILREETREAYRRAIREATPLKEVMPWHKDTRQKIGDPYTVIDTCVKFLDRYPLECLKDNLVPAMESCEKIEVLSQCAKDVAFSPAVATSIVDVPHPEAVKCYVRLQEEGKVFKTEPQPAEPHRAVCAGEREYQATV